MLSPVTAPPFPTTFMLSYHSTLQQCRYENAPRTSKPPDRTLVHPFPRPPAPTPPCVHATTRYDMQ